MEPKEGFAGSEAFLQMTALRQGLTRKSPAEGGIAAKDPAPAKPGRRPKEIRLTTSMACCSGFSGRKNHHFQIRAIRSSKTL
jgi:hypothetical protein